MKTNGNMLLRSVALALLILTSTSPNAAAAAKPELVVAISLDIPPYVMQSAGSGLEVDILRQALPDYTLHFTQLSYDALQTAVQQKRTDVSAGVQVLDDGAYYSTDFITFANYAISKKSDGLKINAISDLGNHPVLAWQNAYRDLGGEFERLFSPHSPKRKIYTEVADQEEQVRMFWQGKGNVIVIDRSIFSYFSKAMGHPMSEVSLHSFFPPVTNFKVSFKDSIVRERFNQGLERLCRHGKYAQLLHLYDVKLDQTVCK